MADYTVQITDSAGNVQDSMTVTVADGGSASGTWSIDNPSAQASISGN